MLTLVGIAVAAVVIWVAVTTIWLVSNQERVVFQPPSVGAPDPPGAQRVAFHATDGNPTFALVVAPANKSARPTVVLVFHGNADLAVWQVPWARELAHRTGAVVVLAEYRGYAGVTGKPSYQGVQHDARGALAFVKTLDPARVVLYGHSLGSAIATELAVEMTTNPPSALVLQSPFTSARDMAARMLVPVVVSTVWSRIARVHYDTRGLVQKLDVPVWVAHGGSDITIPSRMGRDVSDASRRKGEVLIVAGAGHNDVAEVGGDHYWQWMASAVSSAPQSLPVGEPKQERSGRLP